MVVVAVQEQSVSITWHLWSEMIFTAEGRSHGHIWPWDYLSLSYVTTSSKCTTYLILTMSRRRSEASLKRTFRRLWTDPLLNLLASNMFPSLQSAQSLSIIKMVPRGVSTTANAYLTPILREHLDGYSDMAKLDEVVYGWVVSTRCSWGWFFSDGLVRKFEKWCKNASHDVINASLHFFALLFQLIAQPPSSCNSPGYLMLVQNICRLWTDLSCSIDHNTSKLFCRFITIGTCLFQCL